jgi:phosphatidylinositol alpha-1,6-mannosyltransferase
MKKELLITIDYAPETGGVARYLAGYAKRNDCDVLTERKNGYRSEANIRRRNLFWSVRPNWLPLLFWSLAYSRQYEKITVSHILPVGYAALISGKPYTVILHGLDIVLASKTQWKKRMARMILARAEKIIVNSHATGELLERTLGNVYKFEVVYPRIAPLYASQTDLRFAKGWAGKKIILSFGRLVKRKGQETVLRLMPKIFEKIPEALFVIAGSGPERENLQTIAEGLHLQDNVVFLGKASDAELPDIYSACDVFLAPSIPSKDDWEGFGMVCLEAAYFGKPVIVTNTGGLPEAVEDGVTGYVAHDGDELLEKIIYLLQNPETARNMGDIGRGRVMENFLI